MTHERIIDVGSPEYEELRRHHPVFTYNEINGGFYRDGLEFASVTGDFIGDDNALLLAQRIVELLTLYGE